MTDINKLIQNELTHPEKYTPLHKGFLVACLCVFFCAFSIVFYLVKKCVKR